MTLEERMDDLIFRHFRSSKRKSKRKPVISSQFDDLLNNQKISRLEYRDKNILSRIFRKTLEV